MVTEEAGQGLSSWLRIKVWTREGVWVFHKPGERVEDLDPESHRAQVRVHVPVCAAPACSHDAYVHVQHARKLPYVKDATGCDG